MATILDIDINEYILIIRSAFIRVIGENYLDVVNERINRSNLLKYSNFRGIKDYYDYLLECKRNELMLEFFNEADIDIKQFKNINMDKPNYKDFVDLISVYLGSLGAFNYNYYNIGLTSFKDSKPSSVYFQIDFFNTYLFSGNEVVTEENYEEFKKYPVYSMLMEKIQKWIPIIENKKKKYKEYKDSIEPLLTYVKKSEKSLAYIQEQNRIAVYEYLELNYDEKWMGILKEKYKDIKKRSGILGNIDAYFGFSIFSGKYDEILKHGENDERKFIMSKRLEYFYKTGYIDEDVTTFTDNLENLYNDIMSKKDAQELIPSVSIRKRLEKLKKELIDKSEHELLMKDEYFNETMRRERFDPEATKTLADILKSNPVFVTNALCDGKDRTLLFFAIRCLDGGKLDYVLIHEFIHLFFRFSPHKDFILSGFDYLLSNNLELNPYNSDYRLYERFNETITDMFTLDVLKVLHNDFKVFLLEDEKLVRNPQDRNTHSILKNLLYPFYHNYFDVIVESLMEENLNILFDIVGKDNFEKLVDIVNRVDNLIQHFGIIEDIENVRSSSPFYNIYLGIVDETIDLYEKMNIHGDIKKKVNKS